MRTKYLINRLLLRRVFSGKGFLCFLVFAILLIGCAGGKSITPISQPDIKEHPRPVIYIDGEKRQILEKIKASMSINDSGKYELCLWMDTGFKREDFTSYPYEELDITIQFSNGGKPVAELSISFAEFYRDEKQSSDDLTCVKRVVELDKTYRLFRAEYFIKPKE
ncbi:MAG: hypothetical protein K8S56_06460 [Candidatus Cloacimonetes bacterium]|nr:hypothetical protein [Candidatus Cloacimonadota bacterium]